MNAAELAALQALAKTETAVEVRSQLASSAKRLPAGQAFAIIRPLLMRDEDATDQHLPLLIWWAIESKADTGRAELLALVRDPAEQATEAEATVAAVEELIHAYHDCRAALIDPLAEGLDEGAVDSLPSETILSIDELASHHTIEEIYTDRTEVSSNGPSTVRYCATGTVSVTLQWGSNSDLRRGDGAELDENFPFQCLFDVPLEDPRDLSLAEIVSGVDTSSWYGDDWRDDSPGTRKVRANSEPAGQGSSHGRMSTTMTNVPISDDPSGLKSRWEVSVNVGQVLNSTSRTLNVSFVGGCR